jgi:hypothetical protein
MHEDTVRMSGTLSLADRLLQGIVGEGTADIRLWPFGIWNNRGSLGFA